MKKSLIVVCISEIILYLVQCFLFPVIFSNKYFDDDLVLMISTLVIIAIVTPAFQVKFRYWLLGNAFYWSLVLLYCPAWAYEVSLEMRGILQINVLYKPSDTPIIIIVMTSVFLILQFITWSVVSLAKYIYTIKSEGKELRSLLGRFDCGPWLTEPAPLKKSLVIVCISEIILYLVQYVLFPTIFSSRYYPQGTEDGALLIISTIALVAVVTFIFQVRFRYWLLGIVLYGLFVSLYCPLGAYKIGLRGIMDGTSRDKPLDIILVTALVLTLKIFAGTVASLARHIYAKIRKK